MMLMMAGYALSVRCFMAGKLRSGADKKEHDYTSLASVVRSGYVVDKRQVKLLPNIATTLPVILP